MKEFGLEKMIFDKITAVRTQTIFSNKVFVYAKMVPLLADQLLPQLWMEQFDTLAIQWLHIEHMHEGVWFRKKKMTKDSSENLDNIP